MSEFPTVITSVEGNGEPIHYTVAQNIGLGSIRDSEEDFAWEVDGLSQIMTKQYDQICIVTDHSPEDLQNTALPNAMKRNNISQCRVIYTDTGLQGVTEGAVVCLGVVTVVASGAKLITPGRIKRREMIKRSMIALAATGVTLLGWRWISNNEGESNTTLLGKTIRRAINSDAKNVLIIADSDALLDPQNIIDGLKDSDNKGGFGLGESAVVMTIDDKGMLH